MSPRRPPDDKERGPGDHSPDPTKKAGLDTSTQQDNRHLEVALETASAGWPVFPCRPDKTPATRNGFKDATESPPRIEAWWDAHPEYLVAVPTEGLVVVDLDEPDNLEPGASWRWWCQFAEPNGWDPTVTPIVATPTGGVHLYWQKPDDIEIRNSAGKLAPGVDIRANGGYIIAPGSMLPDGREYELLSPYPRALIDAPEWLVDACTAEPVTPIGVTSPAGHGDGTRYGLQALEGELGRLALTPEGQRNHALNTAAFRCGQLAAGGQLDPVHAASALHAVARRIGLSESETVATIRSGMTNGARNPRRPAA